MNMGKIITLQPEVLFESDGSKSNSGTFRRQSVCVPLNLHINLVNEYGGMYKFYPFVGGYFKYSFSGKNGGDELDFEKEYNKREWGMNLGIGLDMMKFQAKLYWQQGFSEISNDTKKSDMFSSAWFFSVGYKF
jgi:aminopeptidase YwaD